MASQRGRSAAASRAAVALMAPDSPGDRVRWGNGRHEGTVQAILDDGRAECVCDADGRRWRLPPSPAAGAAMMQVPTRRRGRITADHSERGFLFALADDGARVFVSTRLFSHSGFDLHLGDEVILEYVASTRSPVAVYVRPVDAGDDE